MKTQFRMLPPCRQIPGFDTPAIDAALRKAMLAGHNRSAPIIVRQRVCAALRAVMCALPRRTAAICAKRLALHPPIIANGQQTRAAVDDAGDLFLDYRVKKGADLGGWTYAGEVAAVRQYALGLGKLLDRALGNVPVSATRFWGKLLRVEVGKHFSQDGARLPAAAFAETIALLVENPGAAYRQFPRALAYLHERRIV